MQEFNCQKRCGECCKWLWVEAPPEGTEDYERLKEWGIVRDLWKDATYEYPAGILVPHRCPNLGEDNTCGIYETRPVACRDYNCINDKLMEKIKNEHI